MSTFSMEAYGQLLTTKQVQDLLNVDRTTIYRMLKDGRLTGIKVGHHWRFPVSEVENLLSGSLVPNQEAQERAATLDVLPLHTVQPIQDVFSEITQVGSVTADIHGNPLTQISHTCDFCKLIQQDKDGYQGCIQSWRKLAQQKEDAPEFVACHAGLEYARARIEVNGELLAILVVGQFYVSEPKPEEEDARLQALAQKYHLDIDLLKNAAQKIPVLDTRTMQRISGWLERVAHTFEQIGVERSDLMNRLRQISEMSLFEP